MIHQNLQETLFKTSQAEVLTTTKMPLAIFSQWHKDGLISFNLAEKQEVSESESLECFFISKLFSSNLSLEILNTLLSKLSKPYSYNVNEIYFDVFKNEWEYLPVIPNDKDIVNEYIDNLKAKDEDEINALIDSLRDKL